MILVAVTTIIYIAINFSIWPLVLPSRKNRETVGESSHSLGVLADAVQRSRWLLILLAFAGLAWGLGGARRLRTAVGLKHLVTAETRIIDDYNWLEAELGPLVPVEVILAMPKSTDGREMLEQFKQVAELHGALESVDESHAVISASTFVPVPPSSAGGIRQIAAAARFRKELFQNQEQLVGLGYLSNAEGVAHWRLTVRVPAMGDVDYGALLTELRSTVERTVTALDRDDVHITGGVPLIYQVQQQLLDDLLVSFLLAFGLVCIALVFVFRSVVCGLICMIPNLFPCAVVFGYLGWQDIRIEVGTVLTASAALGIAVDDTLHFITWFRQRVSEGGTQAESVAYAYRRCGATMIQSTLVITLGLVVFAYSSFAPMQRFAWCMFALLAMALVADLAILPAILLSPLGRPFLPKPVWHPRSLSELAWRVAGPRDAVINFFINAPVALAVYWSVDRVPFVGHPSLLTICGWMSFLLPTITSYFGFLNGVGARKSGALPPAWPEGQKWAISAIVWGLICGVLSYACCVLVLHLLGRTWPDFALSKWQAVAVIGLLAAAMGYFFHSLAVARTHVLGGGEK